VILWSLADGWGQRRLRRHSGTIAGIAFSPDGTALATEESDGAVRIWDVASGREKQALPAVEGSSRKFLEFAPKGKLLASPGTPGNIKLWDAATGAEGLNLGIHRFYVCDAAFSPDGKILASTGSDRRTVLWDTRTGRILSEF
jgi:WD40 repeat protein